MAQEKPEKITAQHSVTMENRKKCLLSGIEKVISATDTLVSVISVSGRMEITGTEIKITEFSEKEKLLILDGTFSSMKYAGQKAPLIKRLFK